MLIKVHSSTMRLPKGDFAARSALDSTLFLLRQQYCCSTWVRFFLGAFQQIYILFSIDNVYIGVVRQPNRYDLKPDEESKRDIWTRVEKMLPSINVYSL